VCIQCRLSAWARGAVARGTTSIGAPCLSMYVVYCMFSFLEGLNTDFVGNTNTIYICLILYTFTVLFLIVVV
jgi:hypothetical protein